MLTHTNYSRTPILKKKGIPVFEHRIEQVQHRTAIPSAGVA